MAANIYDSGTKCVNDHPWGTSYKVALFTVAYTFDATDAVWADLTAGELDGTGYTTGGAAIAGPTTSAGTHATAYVADNTTWTAIDAGTATQAVIYWAGAGDKSLVACLDLASAVVTNGGDLTLKWNNGASAGTVFTITAA